MAASIVVDAGFLVAALSRADRHHAWAMEQAVQYPPPWKTCDAALSEAFHLLGSQGRAVLLAILRKGSLVTAFDSSTEMTRVLLLMNKYENIPMSMADACLVRMSEMYSEHVVLTTDSDFRVYRRHGRQTIRCVLPR
jgi:uncharacterized protein